MKKKGILFLVIGLVLVFATLLTACSLVTVNEERQANRVLATVTVDLKGVEKFKNIDDVMGKDWDYTVSLDITRRELVYTVNSYVSYFANSGYSYNYDTETIVDAAFKSLKTQKYNTIMAMGELMLKAKDKDTGRYDAMYCFTSEYKSLYGNKLVPEGVLTMSERYEAIKDVNDQLQERLDGYVKDDEENEEDKEKTRIDDELSEIYAAGYFVDSITVSYKDGEEMKEGLYKTKVVDDNNSKTEDLDYTKIYAHVKFVKSGAEDKEIYYPVSSSEIKFEDDSDTTTEYGYITARKATVTFNGHVAPENEEEEYDVEAFTATEKYELYKGKTQPTTAEEEDEEEMLEEVRYASRAAWGDITSTAATDGDSEAIKAMKELKSDFFVTSKNTYANAKEKDAYRRLVSYLESANIGYSKDGSNDDHFKGLGYYYNSGFASSVLSAVKYELGEGVADPAEARIATEYDYLVELDKANYEGLTDAEKVEKFLETYQGERTSSGTNYHNGLEKVYYVPIDALLSEKFEIKADDAAYGVLFEDGELKAGAAKFGAYKDETDGKFYMHYAYDNGDGTYNINMFNATHVLFSLANNNDIFKKITGISDLSDEATLELLKTMFINMLKTAPQKSDFLDKAENADDDTELVLSDLYESDEEGNIVYKTYAEAKQALIDALKEDGSLESFKNFMEAYNDDRGALTDSGYAIGVGDVTNQLMDDFVNVAIKIYFTRLLEDKDAVGFIEDADGSYSDENKAYAVGSSYMGEHNMYISFAPLYGVAIDADGSLDINTVLNVDGSTRYQETFDKLLESDKSAAYTNWQQQITDDEVEEASTVNNKYYKRLLKDIKG